MICTCGLVADDGDGPIHAYVVSSPSCWRTLTGLLQTSTHRLFTDAYMVQHAEGDDPRQIQSVTVHLVTLHAIKGHGHDPATASRITSAGVDVGRRIGGYQKLTAPPHWPHTVAEVAAERIGAGEYVDSVYLAWTDWDSETLEQLTEDVLAHLYRGT